MLNPNTMRTSAPTLLDRDGCDRWLNGSFDDLIALQERCFSNELIFVDQTTQASATTKSANVS